MYFQKYYFNFYEFGNLESLLNLLLDNAKVDKSFVVLGHNYVLELTECCPFEMFYENRIQTNFNAIMPWMTSYDICIAIQTILTHLREFVQSDWFLPVLYSLCNLIGSCPCYIQR